MPPEQSGMKQWPEWHRSTATGASSVKEKRREGEGLTNRGILLTEVTIKGDATWTIASPTGLAGIVRGKEGREKGRSREGRKEGKEVGGSMRVKDVRREEEKEGEGEG